MLYHDYLKTVDSCPFCDSGDRIFVSRPSAYLTYAKAPYHKDHLLIIPKRHVESFFDLNKREDEDIRRLIKIGAKIMHQLKYTNFTILVREGNSINKSVGHLHYHIIPNKRIGDLDHAGKPRRIMSVAAIKKMSVRIKECLK